MLDGPLQIVQYLKKNKQIEMHVISVVRVSFRDFYTTSRYKKKQTFSIIIKNETSNLNLFLFKTFVSHLTTIEALHLPHLYLIRCLQFFCIIICKIYRLMYI